MDTGAFPDMQRKHGADNHLAIHANVIGEDFYLAKVMRESYGGHRFKEDAVVSVISLRRINGAGEEG